MKTRKPDPEKSRTWVIAVHGGAGRIAPRRRPGLQAGLNLALEPAAAILSAGGTALDAVIAAVRVLEDIPGFNAGYGSVLNTDLAVETDASVMRGSDRMTGAVAGLSGFRHPVEIARAVMDKTDHVLLAGSGAERFAERLEFERADLVEPAMRRRCLRLRRKWLQGEFNRLPRNLELARQGEPGTVGAVARDNCGGYAAATSTGGVLLKLPGRIGDSALAGAGTWADHQCAVSCTGSGESIIRAVLARRVADAVASGLNAEQAGMAGLEAGAAVGLSAGILLLDVDGQPAAVWNTRDMTWAWSSGPHR